MLGKVLVLLAVLACVGCEPDRGVCLASHEVQHHHDMSVQIIKSGDVDIPIVHPGYDYTVTVCDKWEFPNGRVERDVR